MLENTEKKDTQLERKIELNNNKKLELKTAEENKSNNEVFKIGRKAKNLTKKVNISENVHVIQVESWKKYNLEQMVEPNMNLYINFISEDENKEQSKNGKNKNKRKKNEVKCSCLIL